MAEYGVLPVGDKRRGINGWKAAFSSEIAASISIPGCDGRVKDWGATQ